MNKRLVLWAVLAVVFCGAIFFAKPFFQKKWAVLAEKKQVEALVMAEKFKNGDLIFQTSLSGQSRAIQLATHSKYSHCGLIFKKNGQWLVFEAVQPVRFTPLEAWAARGLDGKFVVKRLKNADSVLTPAALEKIGATGKSFLGKNYDTFFGWSDDKIYCSELIWKIYERATGLELGKLQKLADFDLSSPVVQAKLRQRYGNNLPQNEPVISPARIFDSELLTTVFEGG